MPDMTIGIQGGSVEVGGAYEPEKRKRVRLKEPRENGEREKKRIHQLLLADKARLVGGSVGIYTHPVLGGGW